MDLELAYPDLYDAQVMFEYLEWRTGPHYERWGFIDQGAPASARSDEDVGIDYAHQNEAAWALLRPRLTELVITESAALRLLQGSIRR